MINRRNYHLISLFYALFALAAIQITASAQEPTPELCDAVQKSFVSGPDFADTPEVLAFEGKDSACAVTSGKRPAWSCRLGAITACRPRGGEGTGADPAPLLTLYDHVSEALKACLSGRSPKTYEDHRSLTDQYVEVVRGTEFPPAAEDQGPLMRSARATATGRLDYTADQLCEGLFVDVSVDSNG
jgi:hypothetical protein